MKYNNNNYKTMVLLTITVIFVVFLSMSVIANHNPGHFDTSRSINTKKIDTSTGKTTRENSRIETIAQEACQKQGCYDTDGYSPLKFGTVYLKKDKKTCDKIPDSCIIDRGKSYVKEQICAELSGPGANESLGLGLKTELIECPGGCEKGVCKSVQQDPGLQKCLEIGCYDTDGGNNPTVFGKVLLKKQKAGGLAYCVPSEDSCKPVEINGVKKWFVIEQTCKAQDAGKGYYITEAKSQACEGLCDKGVCQSPTCSDELQNQGETGVDCGGPCDKCIGEFCEDLTGDTPTNKDFVTVNDINGNPLDIYDTCVDNNGNEIKITEVAPSIKKLHEKICVDNQQEDKNYDCEQACVNGKCVKTTCEDTDTVGLNEKPNFIVKGTFTEKIDGVVNEQGTDFCTDQLDILGATAPHVSEGKYILEGVCMLDIGVERGAVLNQLSCPLGCKDGACITCIDSDGLNISIQGTTQGFLSKEDIILANDQTNAIEGDITETDSCYTDIPNWPTKVSSCQGKNCYLREFICNYNVNNDYLMNSYYPSCPQGCVDGACLQCDVVDDSEFSSQVDGVGESDEFEQINLIDGKPIIGDPAAPFTLVMFNAYGDPHAKKWYKETFPLIKHYYIDTGKINFQIREVDPKNWNWLNPNLAQTDRATFCAEEQGKYWEYVDYLLHENFNVYDTAALIEYADYVGMDLIQFQNCLDSPQTQAKVDKDVALSNLFTIDGVPYFVVHDFPAGIEDIVIKGAKDYNSFNTIFQYYQYFGGCYEAKGCYDSDKGIDLGWDSDLGENYEIGITNGYTSDGAYSSQQDTCVSAEDVFGSNYDFANDPNLEPNDVGVIEGSCGNNQQGITVNSDNEFDDYFVEPTQADWYKCEYGCFDGRCSDKKYTKCLDPDGSDIYTKELTKGWTWDNQEISQEDSCLASQDPDSKQSTGDYILEGICSESNDIPFDSFVDTCTFGCIDGACQCPALGWEKIESGTTKHLVGIWGSSSNDVFAVGYDGTILHYNGVSWTEMESGTKVQKVHLSGIWGSSSNDVFAVGWDGTILHYDGNTWTEMESGTPYTLFNIWGSSSNDVFAVGWDGTILHYDGNTWTEMESGTKVGLNGIWGSSSNDVFAVGHDGIILHYNGNTWTEMESGTKVSLSGIWGSSSNDVFATRYEKILHYDGNTWTEMESGTTKYLVGIWGSSSNDIYTVAYNGEIIHSICKTQQETPEGFLVNNCRYIKGGFDNTGKAIPGTNYLLCDVKNNGDQSYNFQELGSYIEADGYFWNQLVKTEVPIQFNPGDSFTFVEQGKMDGLVLNEEYCNGKKINFGIFIDKGLVEDFIYQQEVPVTCFDYNQCPTVVQNWGNLVHKQSTLISGNTGQQETDTCEGDVLYEYICDVNQIKSNQFICPYGCDNGVCLQCNPNELKWEKMESGTTEDLLGVWGSSSNDVFAVGFYNFGLQKSGMILHYDGISWKKMETGAIKTLADIWGSSNNDVFAVGESVFGIEETILHYDGVNWKEMESGTKSLWGIWGSSNNDVFAVGYSGTILHYDGVNWKEMESGTIAGLEGIWGSSNNDVFAVGYSGTILHYDGVIWKKMESGTTEELWDIWGSSSNDVFVAGWGGTILHYDGVSWKKMESNIVGHLLGIFGNSDSDVFATGTGGVILHYDGVSWKKMESGTTVHLSDIWGSSSNDVYIVGDQGTILHLNKACSPIEPTNTCTDTDGGDEPFIYGKTTGLNYDYNEMITGSDQCFTGKEILEMSPNLNLVINSDKTYVQEYYCKETEQITSAYIECPCNQGACGCQDKDGNNIFEANTAKGYETFDETTKNNPQSFIESPDFCTAYSTLEEVKNNPVQYGDYAVESVCKDNIIVGYEEPQKCPEGYHCESGSCVSDEACMQLLDYKKGIPTEKEYLQTISIAPDSNFSKAGARLVFGYPDASFQEPITYLKILPQQKSFYAYNLTFMPPIDLLSNAFFADKHLINFQGYEAEVLDSYYLPNYPSYFMLKLLFSKYTKVFNYPGESISFAFEDGNCHKLTLLESNIQYKSSDPDSLDFDKTWCEFSLDGNAFFIHPGIPDEFSVANNIEFYLNLTEVIVDNKPTYKCKLAIEPRIVKFFNGQDYEASSVTVNNEVITSIKPSVYRKDPYNKNILLGFGYNYTPENTQFLKLGDALTDPLLETFSIRFGYLNDQNQDNPREEISFVGGSSSAEIVFTNNDGQDVTLPLSADAYAYEKAVFIAPSGPKLITSNNLGSAQVTDKELTYWGTDAPVEFDQHPDERVYLEGESCSGLLATENKLTACQEAYFIIIDFNNNAHLMQIKSIDIFNQKMVINDVTYGKSYAISFTVPSSNTYYTYPFDDSPNSKFSLNIVDTTITFSDLGFGGYKQSGNNLELPMRPILTKENASLYLINKYTASQSFEGILFVEHNDQQLPSFNYLGIKQTPGGTLSPADEFVIGAYYDDLNNDIIKFYASTLQETDGFGWYPATKTNNDFEVFMTLKGTKIIYDIADKKSLLIDHPLEAIWGQFLFISKPDKSQTFIDKDYSENSYAFHYNETLRARVPFEKVYNPELLADGEIK
ncbi:thioredoxin domain-containing protein [Candidatus Woesearchaeota archaeon]|nr:thioredoxin domain-containing protein [Candidatus Woesearchaeota archaeon]